MSFDNSYPNRKDHRRPYKGSKSFDRSCRNHGSCGWCEHGRKFSSKRREPLFDWDEFIQERFDDYARYGNEWPTFYVD